MPPTPLLLLLAVAVLLAVLPAAAGEEPTTRPGIRDLGFIAGRWVGSFGDGPAEEAWNAPLGNAMVGTFRAVSKGTTTLYEILVLEETPDGVFLRLRHFDAGLVPWADEAEGPLSYPLVSLRGNVAVFEDAKRPFPQRMTYALEGDDTLRITVGGTRDGKEHAFAFVFRKAKEGS
jgi:hypothetical protein